MDESVRSHDATHDTLGSLPSYMSAKENSSVHSSTPNVRPAKLHRRPSILKPERVSELCSLLLLGLVRRVCVCVCRAGAEVVHYRCW